MAYRVRMTYDEQPFPEYLRSALEASGTTTTALASHFRISPQAVSQWLSGNTMPKASRIGQLRAFFASKMANNDKPPIEAANVAYSEIGAKLAELYRSSGLDHNDVAKKIDVDPLYLEDIGKGRATPSWPLICKLADYFQVGTDFFRGGAIKPLDIGSQISDSLEKRAWLKLWDAMSPEQRTVALGLIRDGLVGSSAVKRA